MSNVLTITGHRPQKLNSEWDGIGPVSDWIRDQIRGVIIARDIKELVSGGALGVDQLGIEVSIEEVVNVLAAIPCNNQDKKWFPKSKKRYQFLMAHPLVEKHVVSPGEYTHNCMQVRNIWMVNYAKAHDGKVLAIWDGSSGGTGNCVEYAHKVGVEVIQRDPTEAVKNANNGE